MAHSVINLDHNATTPVPEAVWEAMRPYVSMGNPASAHQLGRLARKALEDARERVAGRLEAEPGEVVFTSGATEANNLAIFGLVGESPGHVLTSPIEHPCVVEPLKELAGRGFTVETLPVDREGIVDLSDLPQRVRPNTSLVILMRVNHETGAIQPVVPAGEYLWHTDAAQAVGKQAVSFRSLGAASLSLSGHKFGAPPGVGALLVRRGSRLRPSLFGGHQQQGRRPGTESVALAVGLAVALDLACDQLEQNARHVRSLRSRLISQLENTAQPLVINGPASLEAVSPYVLNVSFPGLRGDALMAALDLVGVACATGSACSSGSLLPSPVLQAMNVPGEVLRSALRFSFSHETTLQMIDVAANIVARCAQR
ncbi:MAG: cysteine desulfurase family protein [Gemmataceae bacterium]